MIYRFLLNKKNYKIEVANNTTFHSETAVKVDKEKLRLLIGEMDGDEVKSFFLNNKFYQAEVCRGDDGYPTGIYINGEFFPATLQKIDSLFYYKDKEVKGSKSGTVKSFIPGNIKKIFLNTGDRVAENDIVLIHEAMKMENEIRAPKSGVIKRIGVKEGDNILANHLLFEIE